VRSIGRVVPGRGRRANSLVLHGLVRLRQLTPAHRSTDTRAISLVVRPIAVAAHADNLPIRPGDELHEIFLRRYRVADVLVYVRHFHLGHRLGEMVSHAIVFPTNNKTRPARNADRVLQSARRRLVHGTNILRRPTPTPLE
jgi:hypothetical protein